MLKGLYLYAKYASLLMLKSDRRMLFTDMKRRSGKGLPKTVNSYDEQNIEKSLELACNWVLHSQLVMKDDGIGSYHLINGWSSSYPETSGYLIPSVLNYASVSNNNEMSDRMIKVADWLVSIQKDSGGWAGGRMDDNWPEVVFNTGQIIRGLLAAYKLKPDESYLNSAIRAGDWLVDIQEADGSWKKFASMNQKRVYDSYVDVPLIELSLLTKQENYKNAAIKNLNWIINNKVQENGWFEDCDNTVKRNAKPILHTISYTLDGLLDSGILLDDDSYISAAKSGADELLKQFKKDSYLHGRFDQSWAGSEYMIVTGCAQISIVWMKLFKQSGDIDYLNQAKRMNRILMAIQNRGVNESKNTLGAMPGSFPVWGKYEPFAFPNWATKYFIDALLLEKELTKKD